MPFHSDTIKIVACKNDNKKKKKKVPLEPIRQSCKLCLKWVQATINDLKAIKSIYHIILLLRRSFKKKRPNFKIKKKKKKKKNPKTIHFKLICAFFSLLTSCRQPKLSTEIRFDFWVKISVFNIFVNYTTDWIISNLFEMTCPFILNSLFSNTVSV